MRGCVTKVANVPRKKKSVALLKSKTEQLVLLAEKYYYWFLYLQEFISKSLLKVTGIEPWTGKKFVFY